MSVVPYRQWTSKLYGPRHLRSCLVYLSGQPLFLFAIDLGPRDKNVQSIPLIGPQAGSQAPEIPLLLWLCPFKSDIEGILFQNGPSNPNFVCRQTQHKSQRNHLLLLPFNMGQARLLTFIHGAIFAHRVPSTDVLRNVSSFSKRSSSLFDHTRLSRVTLPIVHCRGTSFTPSGSSAIPRSATMSSSACLEDDKKYFREVLPVDKDAHKGQGGKVAVIGGSKDYTGAPFFASMSAFRAGAELVYVLAYPEAASVLKTYSPDLIVKTVSEFSVGSSFSDELSRFLDGVHAIVVGPGLGLEDDAKSAVLCALASSHVPIVLDADALSLVAHDEKCNQAVRNACHDRKVPIVFTPNVPELKRLAKSMDLDENADAKEVAKSLGPAAVVVAKGPADLVVSRDRCATVKLSGSEKRVGGQGDILAGCIAISSAWAIRAQEASDSGINYNNFVSCVIIACCIAREASARAYKAHRRGLLASDILPFVTAVVEDIEDVESKRLNF